MKKISSVVDNMIREEIERQSSADLFSDRILVEARIIVADDESDIDLDTVLTEDNIDAATKLIGNAADDFEKEVSNENDKSETDKSEESQDDLDLEGIDLKDVDEPITEDEIAIKKDMEPSSEKSTDPMDVASRAVDMVLEILRYQNPKTASVREIVAYEVLEAKSKINLHQKKQRGGPKPSRMPSRKDDNWFKSLTPPKQREHCQEHPGSEYCNTETKKPEEKVPETPKVETKPSVPETPKVEKTPETVEKPEAPKPEEKVQKFEYENRKDTPLATKDRNKVLKEERLTSPLELVQKMMEGQGVSSSMWGKRMESLTEKDVADIKNAIANSLNDAGTNIDAKKMTQNIHDVLFKPVQEKPTEKKPEEKVEDVTKEKKEDKAPKEKSESPVVTQIKEIGDGPFEFESRDEKPLSESEYNKSMGKDSGTAMMLDAVRESFVNAGKESLFDKRIGKGVLSKGDIDAVNKAVMDSSVDGKYEQAAMVKAVTNALFKPTDKSSSKEEAPKEEAPKEETPVDEKGPDESPKGDNPFGEAKSLGKHEMYSGPVDLKDKESWKSQGYRELSPGSLKVSDDLIIVNPKTGDRYRFGDLPKETQSKIKKNIAKNGAVGMPKKSEPKTEKEDEAPAPAPTSDVKKNKDIVVKALGDLTGGVSGIGKSLAKSVSKSFARLIGKGAGKTVNFGKKVRSLAKKSKKSLINEYVNKKKTVRDLLADLWSEAASGYSTAKTSSIRFAAIDAIMAESIADNIARMAARGMQVNRKDKDTMSDTGGSSKGRQRQPWIKPPRDDLKNPLSKKRKPSSEHDMDIDNDPDM